MRLMFHEGGNCLAVVWAAAAAGTRAKITTSAHENFWQAVMALLLK
jgi:hypothetical protein